MTTRMPDDTEKAHEQGSHGNENNYRYRHDATLGLYVGLLCGSNVGIIQAADRTLGGYAQAAGGSPAGGL